MTTRNHHLLIILGSGPAGLSAALYVGRAALNPMVLSGTYLYGQAALTSIIENYPGFPEGVSGEKLGQLFQQQAELFGASITYDQAIKVDLSTRPFMIKTYSDQYDTDSLIIATGADPKRLNIPGEKELTGRGVSYCATCDGAFYRNKKVIVVGGGDSAIEEGIFLTRFASSVTIVHRRDILRAGAILEKRAKSNPKINFIWNSVVMEILGNDTVESGHIKNVKTGEEELIRTDGVFIFIGHSPNSNLFEGQLEMDEKGYIKVDNLMHTSVPGVFAAGEIADPYFRQVVTSAGMGAAAGIQALHYLESLGESK